MKQIMCRFLYQENLSTESTKLSLRSTNSPWLGSMTLYKDNFYPCLLGYVFFHQLGVRYGCLDIADNIVIYLRLLVETKIMSF